MKITVCIGSSCHVKGSKQVIEELQYLIADNHLEDKVELGGMFCMERCQEGVCATLDGKFFSLSPENTKAFFTENVLKVLK